MQVLTPFPEFISPSIFVSIFSISGPKKLIIGVPSLPSFRYEQPSRTKVLLLPYCNGNHESAGNCDLPCIFTNLKILTYKDAPLL